MLEDFRLKVFMAAVQERSFTKAASALGITQPSVSQNIADLEKMAGRKLFDRLRGSVELTAEGEVFKVYVDKLQEIYSQMDDMFAKLPPATVRLSASEELYTYLIGPALEAFVRVHPDIVIERCRSRHCSGSFGHASGRGSRDDTDVNFQADGFRCHLPAFTEIRMHQAMSPDRQIHQRQYIK